MKQYSIIIPHYNVPDLLRRCLDSIPDRNDIEVMIIDDNSDPSIVDFDSFPGLNRSNIRCIFLDEHKGAGYARNKGIEEANGKWILFVDADDFLLPNAFESIDQYVDKDFDVVLFKARSSLSSDISKVGKRTHATHLNTLIDECLNEEIPPKEVLFRILSPWCKLAKRKFLIDNAVLFDLTKLGGEDVIWSTKLAICSNRIELSTSYIYNLTERDGSLTDNVTVESFKNACDVFLRRNDMLNEHGYIQYKSFIPYAELIKLVQLSRVTYIKYIFRTIYHKLLEEKPLYRFEIFMGFKYSYIYLLMALLNFPTIKKIFKVGSINWLCLIF